MNYNKETAKSRLQCRSCNQKIDDSTKSTWSNICCLNVVIGQFSKCDSLKCKNCKIIHFKEELDKFERTINSLNDKQQNYKRDLSDYCEFVRSRIVLRTESIITDLNKHCDEMCETIDDYENVKKKEWDNENEEYRNSLTKLINDNRTVQNNMMELVTNQTKKTAQIKKAIELMKQNSIEIEEARNKMSKKVFNLKYLQNDQDIDIDSIGGILKAEKYEKLNLTEKLLNTSLFDCSFYLDGKVLVVLHDDEDHSYYINTFNLHHPYLVTGLESCLDAGNSIQCFYLFNNYIIIVSSIQTCIYKYDSFLNTFLYHWTRFVPRYLKCITICADILYIFTMNEKFEVNYLNWRLNNVKTIGQTEHQDEPFYFKDVIQMDIRNHRFYLRKLNKIEILSEISGNVLKTIEISCHKFIINDDHLVVFCDNFLIKWYQLGTGNLISEIDLKGSIPNGFKFHDYKDGKYLLSSKNKKDLYSIKI
jgi:hypothetical protein